MRWLVLGSVVACGGGAVGDGDGILDADEVPEVGWIAELDGTAHDVSGTVEIVDERRLELRDFTYDGGGLNARFFLLVDGEDFHRDLELTDNLVGSPSDGGTMTLEIPDGAGFEDFNLITLWCIPAGVAFGAGVFQAP